ncbi:MAG: hypothetical protein JWN45_772, partial [Acidobacteriaceae bacterium]|nr:hypothetical protein [Acidobacteriaceae bacterium]
MFSREKQPLLESNLNSTLFFTLPTFPTMLRLLFAIALTITPATSVTAPPLSKPAESARALPLNRFPASRLTQTEQGFYFMPTAIGDDYFDGTSDVNRIRRHLQ